MSNRHIAEPAGSVLDFHSIGNNTLIKIRAVGPYTVLTMAALLTLVAILGGDFGGSSGALGWMLPVILGTALIPIAITWSFWASIDVLIDQQNRCIRRS